MSMADIWKDGDQRYLMLADAYLPSMHELLAVAPQRPARFRLGKMEFRSREHALAWILSAVARRKSYHQKVFSIDDALAFPCHTWVFRPPQSTWTPLNEWFAGEPSDSQLRLTMQSTPSRLGDRLIPDLTSYVYSDAKLDLKRKFVRWGPGRQIRLPQALKESGLHFLDRFEAVHQSGPAAVDEYLDSIGCDYVRSDGLPEPPLTS